jgi:propionate CoA-transferase
MAKVMTARQAAELIEDGTTIAWTTASMCGFAEEVASAVEKRFLEMGKPRNLTLTHSCGCGDYPFGDVMQMNNHGSSLIYGHPQAPTAGRIIAEMLEEMVILGVGYCLRAGCAAGDTGAAMVFKVR